MHPSSRVRNPNDVDEVISAEFPNKEQEPELFKKVRAYMTHICAPGRCIEHGRCIREFPKSVQPATEFLEDSFVAYRRRDIPSVDAPDKPVVTYQHVVPYNRLLIQLFDCHINVECCVSIKAFKYIYKYVYKGHDRVVLEQTADHDEVKQYLDSRYVSPPEAIYRLLRFRLHEEHPSILRLQVHLPDAQTVVYAVGATADEIHQQAQNRTSTLIEFFKYNQVHPHGDQRNLLYQQFPASFVWVKERGRSFTWRPRQRGFQIGRMYFVPAREGERYYIRLLLTVVRGPCSFEDLRTVEGHTYPTFREACQAHGLLDDDGEWRSCLDDAATFKHAHALRCLFVLIITDCAPVAPDELWEHAKVDLSDDLRHHLITHQIAGFTRANPPSDEQRYDFCLYLLNQECLRRTGHSIQEVSEDRIPRAQHPWEREIPNPLIQEQRQWNVEDQACCAQDEMGLLNDE